MPNTRKKIIKTVYKDENDSDAGDFSDSGSEACISDPPSSDDNESSAEEFVETQKKQPKPRARNKQIFAKSFIKKIEKNMSTGCENEEVDVAPALFSVKDLTDADKLLPSTLNLSESDSSDDESPNISVQNNMSSTIASYPAQDSDSDGNNETEYKDVWSSNIQESSEEIAKKTYMELEQHKANIERTKESISKYTAKVENERESDIKDLLAQGEEVVFEQTILKNKRRRKPKDDSDSDVEDWEEVKENKAIPQQGLQLIVDLPGAVCRKSKKIDIEMMMKRKINRVKKEYQVYMHKVHVLCWFGHGNYVSQVLNDQEVMAAALSLVPSKECYPSERVDMKYVEQITTWFNDKFSLKLDKNEDKFKPKALPLKDILKGQIKLKVATMRKYLVFIFVAMLRAIGLQCRVMFNFVTLPIKPPTSELCSLSTKIKDEPKTEANKTTTKNSNSNKKSHKTNKQTNTKKLAQVDGNYDITSESDSDFENIFQIDGNDDSLTVKTRKTRSKKEISDIIDKANDDVSPPKRARKPPSPKPPKISDNISTKTTDNKISKTSPLKRKVINGSDDNSDSKSIPAKKVPKKPHVTTDSNKSSDNILSTKQAVSPRKTRRTNLTALNVSNKTETASKNKLNNLNPPTIIVTENDTNTISCKYFAPGKSGDKNKLSAPRKRSETTVNKEDKDTDTKVIKSKSRTKSAPGTLVEKSKYFNDTERKPIERNQLSTRQRKKTDNTNEDDAQRVSHKDLVKKSKSQNDVTKDLVNIIKGRIKESKEESKKRLVKGKIKQESDDDSDYLPVEPPGRNSASDDDFKPSKISPKPSTSRKIDRRVISSDEDTPKNKMNVWCEVYVEELEQWVAVDVIKGKIHCTSDIYNRATHPVAYIVGWDNNNYLKDLTRRYVPHWNTVTRKQRVEPNWWDTAVKPWLGPKTARDREEDEYLDRMQLEAPLPKSIAEYKNHPLYALKRHLLKFEAIYPPDSATLGFVRGEPVYSRDCVYTCRSRDTWLKEAKVVRLGEQPYKVVKARPKWDKLSNQLITDKPLEIFGPWQVKDYEPPEAENGIVPRNAYGNVELFKDCMLPKGTVHIKLPGLNRVAKKLNIDCAPAMTGFDFNGGWSHPVFDGFVVCTEYEQIITEAWLKDQEDQERKEQEKIELRVYGHWRRLIKGLMIRERLKLKYGFDDLSATKDTKKKSKGPKLTVKKK